MILPRVNWDLVSSSKSPRLSPRKGGGAGHGSSGGKGSSSGKSSSSSTGSTSSKGAKGGSISIPYSGTSKTFSASPASGGGGVPALIPSGTPFSGRLFGGATRDQVYGTSRIGSGYPYGAYGSYYGGRPFPYGFYPLYIAPAYYGGDEYGPDTNGTRPGGELATAVLKSNNASITDSFYIFGDHSSVSMVLDSLVSECGIANITVTATFPNGTLANGTSSSLVPHPEQIVQYYRASSFALALSTYNNSAALPANAPTSNTSTVPPISADTPLPTGLNLTLLTCLNTTIAVSVPLLDNASNKHKLSTADITWIVFATIVGLFFVFLLWTCCSWRCKRQRAST